MAHRNFARAMRRKTQWAGFSAAAGGQTLPVAVNVAAAAVGIVSAGFTIAGGSGAVDEEVTVTRTLGIARFKMDAATALLSAQFAMGCIVARNEAVTAGVASLANPITDPDAEWLYYVTGNLLRGNAANDEDGTSTATIPFDVRGQRIVRAGSTLVWIAAAQTAAVQSMVGGRYLLKLT